MLLNRYAVRAEPVPLRNTLQWRVQTAEMERPDTLITAKQVAPIPAHFATVAILLCHLLQNLIVISPLEVAIVVYQGCADPGSDPFSNDREVLANLQDD